MYHMERVSKVYTKGKSQVKALDSIRLNINRHEFLAVCGKSGSGKSTLLHILGCLDRPDQGVYRVEGMDVGKLSDRALADLRNRKFGFVFQSFHLLPRYSALENVMLPFLFSNTPHTEHKRKAMKMLERVGLSDRAAHRPSELSGGQQQRVAIARALVNEPDVILADEPTGALDTQSGAMIMDILTELHREGKTVIVITHEEEVASRCDTRITMSDGKIVSDTRLSNEPMQKEKIAL